MKTSSSVLLEVLGLVAGSFGIVGLLKLVSSVLEALGSLK